MKPLSLAILCLFILAPFLIMTRIRCDALAATQSLRAHYDAVLDTAVSDASESLAWQMTGSGYADPVGDPLSEALAVETFFSSLGDGLGITGEASMDRLRSRVPVVVVAGRTQANLYLVCPSMTEGESGHSRHVCLQSVPYAWERAPGELLVMFTMGDEIRVVNQLSGNPTTGHWQMYSSDGQMSTGENVSVVSRLFQSEEAFTGHKLRVIRDVVRSLLEKGILLSTRQEEMGTLLLPTSQDAAFRNAIADVGIFAFVRGLPVGSSREYQTYAFGGGRVVCREPVTGWENAGRKVYCSPACPVLRAALGAPPEGEAERFSYYSTPAEAAEQGYAPCVHCRP